ncbi:hypothetical protein PspLS_11442 [Pyricularia sp. CBS 133598]|nr:hypothetical protein PspLS_11442 [Pyricularia sp. CBS 133598]
MSTFQSYKRAIAPSSGDDSDAAPLLPKANTRRWIDNQFGRVLRFQFGIPNLDCFVNRSLHSILHSSTVPENIKLFLGNLEVRGIEFCETDGRSAPAEAAMHNLGAVVPKFVISPKSEYGVSQTLMLLKDFDLYKRIAVSIKSGGHGYFSGGPCPGIMLNLGKMCGQRMEGDNTLVLEPGCVLGQVINTLATNRKALPHGNCFGIGAGGHFLTAGWDIALSRPYGLGCQSVVGGRIALWDGSIVEVNQQSQPDLLYAMRGGAAAAVGVVTRIRLRLIDEPPSVTWCFAPIDKTQLQLCVAKKAFANARGLPRAITVSFRFYFEPHQKDPVCSFNITSLLSAKETTEFLRRYLGPELVELVADSSLWNEKSLIKLRLLPASDALAADPRMLAEVSSTALQENPLVYWTQTAALREMASSYFSSVSCWVVPECEPMFLDLYNALASVQSHPARGRMHALVVQGGGRMSELQKDCSMPLGQALARFEVHWDDAKEETWCRDFTDNVRGILQSKKDHGPGRPYRGDAWLREQTGDERLDEIFQQYDRRFEAAA